MKVLRLLWLVLICLSSLDVARADQGTDDFKFAQGLYQNERWSLAEEAFLKFLTAHPGHDQMPLATLYLGLTQIQNTKYAEARKTLTTFVTKYPNSRDVAHADFRIAECSYYLGDFEAAATAFDRALKKYPEDPFREFAWAYLGESQRRLGRHREAAASLQKSLDLFPRGRMAAEARFGLAQATEALGESDTALKLYREVTADSAADRAPEAQLAIAGLLFEKKDFDQALAEYQNVEKRFPKSALIPVARLNAGYAAYQKNDYQKALTFFDQAEDEPSQKLKAGYWKGLTLKALRDYSGAATVLQEAASAAANDPLTESILYQLADCHLKSGQLLDAEKRFLEVSDRFPRGSFGDHSLYFATDCILKQTRDLKDAPRTARLRDAELLLDRFEREYPASEIRLPHDLQRGQFLLMRSVEGDLVKAEIAYRRVLDNSRMDQTRNEARYQLARLKQLQKDNATALELIRPLALDVQTDANKGFPEALILFGALARDAAQHSEAIRAAKTYLDREAQGVLRDQAWSIVAVSAARSGNWKETDSAIEQLLTAHAGSPVLSQNLQLVADIAFEAKEWDRSIRFFKALMAPGKDSPFHPAALSGLAWSEFQKGDYSASEAHFREFTQQHPQHELAPEAAFMIGDSLQKAGQKEKATTAFQDAFEKYKPARRAYLAGLQAARLLILQMKIEDADRAYTALDLAFPKEKERPLVLDEWAAALAAAEQYDRADAVYQKLATEFPDSDLADNARFNLAESDLVNGRLEAARKNFEQLVSSPKSDVKVREDSLYRLVALAVEVQDWKDVVDKAGKLAEQFPQSDYVPEAKFQQGNAQLNLSQLEPAEKTLLAVSELSNRPKVAQQEWFPHVWPLLAEAQVRQKKYSDVLKTADRMRQWQPESALLYLVDEVVGRAFKNQARFEEARQAFQRVTSSKAGEKTETAAKAQLMLAETHFLQQQYKEARDAYLRVHFLYQFPEWQAAALFQSGKCAELLKLPQEAAKDYQLLIDQFKDSEYAKQAADRLKSL